MSERRIFSGLFELKEKRRQKRTHELDNLKLEIDPRFDEILTAFRLEDLITRRKTLPTDWLQQLSEFAQTHKIPATLTGGEGTSLEEMGTTIQYELVSGGKLIRKNLPWLWKLYNTTLFDTAKIVTAEQLTVAKDHDSAMVINVTTTKGYEWHEDDNAVTGLLYVTDGGELQVKINGEIVTYIPRAGDFVVFKGKRPHRVLGTPHERIAIPMNFYSSGDHGKMSREIKAQMGMTN